VKNLKIFVCILALFPCLSLYSQNFGLLLDQSAGTTISIGGGTEEPGDINYSGAVIPRFSSPVGENGNLFISASARAELANGIFVIIPELLRSDFSYSFGNGEFKFGRMGYQDPLGFIASGLFDGVNVSIDVGGGSVGVGVWYTGLLYKERANITMTKKDMDTYYIPFEFSNFQETYFASRRVVSAVEYEHQGLFEKAQLKVALIGQFDLSGEGKYNLNSQYAAGKLSYPVDSFIFDAGAVIEMVEYAGKNSLAMAGTLGASYMFSSSRLSLSGIYSSGVADNGSFTAFTPLTTVYQGNVLDAKLSGLSIVSIDYLGRFRKTFSAGFSASSFIRTDLGTYVYPSPSEEKNGYIVGTEFFGRLWWNPVSDIQLNFGGGAFLPSLGNMDPKAATIIRVELNLVLTLY